MKAFRMLLGLLVLLGWLVFGIFAFSVTAFPQEMPKQTRYLGNKAVMHVYWYSPSTLEVTAVDSYLFKDEDACKAAIPKAFIIAAPTTSQGDLIAVKCISLHPPVHDKPPPKGSTRL